MDKKQLKKFAKKFLKTCVMLLYTSLVKKKKNHSEKGLAHEPEKN